MNNHQSYKQSEIDWVGEIPSHWETVQPKYRLNRVTRPIEEDDEVITCFRDGVVTLRKNRREEGFTNSIKEHGYQQIKPGDLVVHEMDGFAGAIGVSDSKGKATPVYTVIEPDGRADLSYVAYLLKEMSRSGKIESLARSIRERTTDFRWNMWSVINFPFPPIEEQNRISRYLDKKTNQID
jgi:type I restriction enzyme S subunit